MKNHIKSELIKERINHLLSTQATTKTALAHIDRFFFVEKFALSCSLKKFGMKKQKSSE